MVCFGCGGLIPPWLGWAHCGAQCMQLHLAGVWSWWCVPLGPRCSWPWSPSGATPWTTQAPVSPGVALVSQSFLCCHRWAGSAFTRSMVRSGLPLPLCDLVPTSAVGGGAERGSGAWPHTGLAGEPRRLGPGLPWRWTWRGWPRCCWFQLLTCPGPLAVVAGLACFAGGSYRQVGSRLCFAERDHCLSETWQLQRNNRTVTHLL